VASAFFRGKGEGRRWFARFKDPAGRWRAKRVRVQTRGETLRIARQLEAQAERRRYGLEPPESAGLLVRDLLERFRMTLTNRSWKDDASRLRLHVVPRWGALRIDQVTLPAIMAWLDDMRAEGRIAPQTQRHALGLLSRAFSWAVARGLAPLNPVRLVPPGARPQATPTRAGDAWLADDETPRRIMALLPEPHRWIFYVAFTTGCRLGEVLGLRLSDLDDLAAGCVRVRGQYDGRPLKEDKKGAGRVKFAPASTDAVGVLEPWLARRRAEGAGPEDLVFPGPGGRAIARHVVAHRWGRAREALGLAVTWHQATRTSAASRWASRGVDVGQISAALGHHGTEIALRHYMKFQRRVFDARMTVPLSTGAAGPEAAPGSPGLAEPAAARRPRNQGGMNTTDQDQGVTHAP
jgi:integrase